MRLFVTTQESSNLSRLAYQVFYNDKPLLNTSYLGLDIQDQEPLLGENVGLTSSVFSKGTLYNSLFARYMQNGSLGCLIYIEARAYDDGVAFRYIIPKSTPLLELPIAEEATEFALAGGNYSVTISESKIEGFPRMKLISESPATMTKLTRLEGKFHGTTPWTGPWRIISIGSSLETSVFRDLKR
jgi:hypothetical protein